MTCINALITENPAYFVNSFKSAYDESLEVELQTDSELNVLVESIIVSLEGSCSSAASVGYQHGSLNLHEALCIEVASDG